MVSRTSSCCSSASTRAGHGFDRRPLRIRVRLGDARRFPDAPDLHVMFELGLALIDRTADRRRRRRLGRAGQRDVPFAGQ